MKQFDYSALQSPVSFADARPDMSATFKSMLKITVNSILISVILVMFFVSAIATYRTSPLFWAMHGGFVLALCFVGYYFLFKNAKHKVRLTRFATQNGMEIAFDNKNPMLEGLYFQVGDDRVLTAELKSPQEGITIGQYKYNVSSGNSKTTKTVGFAKFTLTRKLPHIVLDNQHNNFWKMSNLPAYFSSNQKLSLEGDFDSHFTLYAPKEYERDALYIFTPDVMANFIDNGYAFDAEIVDDCLYMYTDKNSDLTNEKYFKTVYAAIRSLGHKIEQQSDYYKDDRVASRAENVVAHQGRRLKPGLSALAIIVIVFFIPFQVVQFSQGAIQLNSIAMIPIVLVTIIASFIAWRKYSKNN